MEVPPSSVCALPFRAGVQGPQSLQASQAELDGFILGQEGHPFSNQQHLTSQPMHGQQKTWNEGLVWTGLLQTVPWPYAWGIPVFQEAPASYQQYHKAER